MSTFQATLTFIALDENTPPRATNLLFYNQQNNWLSKGWIDKEGTTILVGGNFVPSHYALYEEQVEKQSGRLRTFGVSKETGEYEEIQALSHPDAVMRYRQQNGIVGAAKLRTTDTEAVFGRRTGVHYINHDTSSFIQPIIFWRNSYTGGDGWSYYAKRITIGANCPTCGQPRGPLTGGRVVEDGETSFVNEWTNPCGHQDSYKTAYLEYLQLKKDGVLTSEGLPVAGDILPLPQEAMQPNDARRHSPA